MSDRSYTGVCALFSVALVVADLVAPRLTTVGPFTFTAGMVAFPLTFIATDLVHERWGRDAARFMTWVGLGASMLAALLVSCATRLPEAPVGLPAPVFAQAFGGSIRIVAASLAAYVASQLLDIAVFQRVGDRGFLVRATVSTVLSQGVDTLVFTALAFGWTTPTAVGAQIALSLYIAKAVAAGLAVPVLAAARKALV